MTTIIVAAAMIENSSNSSDRIKNIDMCILFVSGYRSTCFSLRFSIIFAQKHPIFQLFLQEILFSFLGMVFCGFCTAFLQKNKFVKGSP